MRSISLVKKIELEFKGNVFQNAVCLVDVDNDGYKELCICNTAGDLHVFKGIRSGKPWKVNRSMGSVVVLCGGKVRDCDENVLCSLDTEGRCHLFDVHDENKVDEELHSGSCKSPSRASSPSRAGELRLVHHERLIPNAKVAVLEDIDDDGTDELIVGYTDRWVRIYKWQLKDAEENSPEVSTTSKNILVKQGSKDLGSKAMLVKQGSKEEDGRKTALSTTMSGGTSIPKMETKDGVVYHTMADSDRKKSISNYHAVGTFVMVKQFSLLAQLGSLAVCKTVEGMNQVIVSQPNGGYCILGAYDLQSGFSERTDTPTSVDSPTLPRQESFPVFYPINAKSARSGSHTNTEIIGGIKRQNELTGVIGVCTQDGNFIILDNSSTYNTHPAKNQSEHRWFSMSKLDVTNNGDDEIVLCSMSGMTYIIDKERDIVSFNFNENVAAFCAGAYGLEEQTASPCLCYVTLSGKICMYYNVWIDAMKVKCVHGALIEKIKQREDLTYILDMFKLPNGEIDHQKVQNLVKNIWSEKF